MVLAEVPVSILFPGSYWTASLGEGMHLKQYAHTDPHSIINSQKMEPIKCSVSNLIFSVKENSVILKPLDALMPPMCYYC